MNSLGDIIRRQREEKQLPLRAIAAVLDIDQAILSKIERGQRIATREQVIKLAGYFSLNQNDLLITWLSDKLLYEVENEEVGLEALQVAEQRASYLAQPVINTGNLIHQIKNTLSKDGRVANAWLFGSVARGEATPKSDVDIMVELNDARKYSLFDLIDIAYVIETNIRRKVDLVEKGYLKDFAQQSANADMIQIYG